MKKKTIDLLTTLIAVVLFAFSLATYWFDKMDGVTLISISVVSVALIVFKNEKFEAFVNNILK